MSGEAIASPVVIPIAIAGVAAAGVGLAAVEVGKAGVVVGSGVARGVRSRIEAEAVRAREAAADEHRRAAAHRDRETAQQAEMNAVRQRLDDITARLAQASARGSARPVDPEAPREDFAPRFLDASAQDTQDFRQQAADLADFRAELDAVPADLEQLSGAAFSTLRDHADKIARQLKKREPVSDYAIDAFGQSVRRTIEAQLARLTTQRAAQSELVSRADALHERARFLSHLSRREADQAGALGRQLAALIDAPDRLDEAALDTIDTQLSELQSQVERSVYIDALRPELVGAVSENLVEMGYRAVSPFPDPAPQSGPADATMAMPGGLNMAVRVTEDACLAFQLRDEQNRRIDDCDAERTDYVRDQERRWCRDLHELMGRLAGQGFPCELQHEREIPLELNIARMESAQDWPQSEGKQKQAEKKQKKNKRRRRRRAMQRGGST